MVVALPYREAWFFYGSGGELLGISYLTNSGISLFSYYKFYKTGIAFALRLL